MSGQITQAIKESRSYLISLTIFFSCMTTLTLYMGNKWAGAKADYQDQFLPLINFFTQHFHLPPSAEYRAPSFPIWPMFGGLIMRLTQSEIVLIVIQLIVGLLASLCFYALCQSYGISKISSSLLAGSFISSIYVLSGSLNPTTDVPAYLFLILILLSIAKTDEEEQGAKTDYRMAALMVLLVGTRQMFLWFVVIIWILKAIQLGRKVFLRKYLLSIVLTVSLTTFMYFYFGNNLLPTRTAAAFKIPFPSVINLAVISTIGALFLTPLILRNMKEMFQSIYFISSFLVLNITQFVFLKQDLLNRKLLENYDWGWPSIWMKFGQDAWIIPLLSTSFFISFLIWYFGFKDRQLDTILYFTGLILSALIIGAPYNRYFEIPILIGVALIFRNIKPSKSTIEGLYAPYLFLFQLSTTLIKIM